MKTMIIHINKVGFLQVTNSVEFFHNGTVWKCCRTYRTVRVYNFLKEIKRKQEEGKKNINLMLCSLMNSVKNI